MPVDPTDLVEFGNPNDNTVDVAKPGDVIQPNPDAVFTDEEPDQGLE